MNRVTGPSKVSKVARTLLAAVAVAGIALGAAACGPSSPHPKKSTQGPAGY